MAGPSGSAFGIPDWAQDDEGDDTQLDLSDDAVDEPVDDDQPTLTTIGDDDEGDEAPPLAVVEDDEEVEEPDQPELEAAPGQVKIADRYDSLENFERGYKEIQGAFTRVVQENRTLVESQQAMVAQMEALQTQQNQLQELLMQQAMEADPELAEQMQAQQQMDRLLSERVNQQVAPLAQQLADQRIQQLQQQQMVQAEQVIRSFWSEHGITQGDEVDVAMGETMKELLSAGVALSPADRDHLELMYEAAQNPALKYELAVNRDALALPGGVDYIRSRAGATIASAGAPQGTPPKPRGAVRKRVESYVEPGSGGTPPSQGAPEKDEFDEAAEWYQKRFNKGPLFGSAR